jgi:P-type Na+/K+ transporter
MLTGDHPETASAIAKDVGILPDNISERSINVQRTMVMTATRFDGMTDEEIDGLSDLPLVIARCAPSTKVRMIEALHRRGALAAMTGDGVNDSPSLKKADVGIAMGINGSDVAKDVSEVVLVDDQFASIVIAIEEGRRMFDNICKFVLHLLCSNVGEVILLVVGLAFKDADNVSVFPLSPLEILWINMITSSFPAIGLGMEKAVPDVMERKPVNAKKVLKFQCQTNSGRIFQLSTHRYGSLRRLDGDTISHDLRNHRFRRRGRQPRLRLQRTLFPRM